MREVAFPGKAVGSCSLRVSGASGRSSKACMTGFTSPSPSSPRSFQRRARPMTQCGQLKSDQTSIVIIRFSGSHAAPPPVLSHYSPLSSAARTGDTGFPFPLCRPAGKGADCLLFRKKSGRPFPYKRKNVRFPVSLFRLSHGNCRQYPSEASQWRACSSASCHCPSRQASPHSG